VEVRLDDPLGFTRSETEELFQGARPLAEILRGLVGEPKEETSAVVTTSRGSHYQH
jgi:hypothetical protein